VQSLRFFIWFWRFAWPVRAIHAQRALCSRSGAGHRGGAAGGQAAPRHFDASPWRVVLRRCGGHSASRIENPILAAQNSSATLKVFHLVLAFRMASVRYPCTAGVVQSQWGRLQGERSRCAGGAASFCRAARACSAAAVGGGQGASRIENPMLAAQNPSARTHVSSGATRAFIQEGPCCGPPGAYWSFEARALGF
jgi:hypothetical protein